MRGVRAHFTTFVDALSEREARAAQLGLAHSYSRAKVRCSALGPRPGGRPGPRLGLARWEDQPFTLQCYHCLPAWPMLP